MRGIRNEGLILFKQHFSKSCPVHSMTKLSASARRFYFECSCPFWIMGKMPTGEVVPRQSLDVSTLAEAQGLRDSYTLERKTKAQDEAVHGVSIAEAMNTYLAWRETGGDDAISERTLKQIALVLRRLRSYCEARNVVHMKGITVDILERFKVEALPKRSTTKATAWAKIRHFLKIASRREWLSADILLKLSTAKAVYEQKKPYKDEEVQKILAEAERLNGGSTGYASRAKTFRLLLELMLETGLRVSDAVVFNPAVLERGAQLWIYTYYPKKQSRGKELKAAEVFITDRLKQAIDTCEWMTPGQWPFRYGKGSPEQVAQAVYERMQEVGKRCGIADCRPHRLRDTFAVRCLLRGMQLEDVSRLLAHSSVKVTEKYYARWIDARKRRLEGLLAQTLMNA